MADPVVLIGIAAEDGSLGVVGLYETAEAAQAAVQQGALPGGYHYSVMTPEMGSYTAVRGEPEPEPELTDEDLEEAAHATKSPALPPVITSRSPAHSPAVMVP